jgi:hypothetical protein
LGWDAQNKLSQKIATPRIFFTILFTIRKKDSKGLAADDGAIF